MSEGGRESKGPLRPMAPPFGGLRAARPLTRPTPAPAAPAPATPAVVEPRELPVAPRAAQPTPARSTPAAGASSVEPSAAPRLATPGGVPALQPHGDPLLDLARPAGAESGESSAHESIDLHSSFADEELDGPVADALPTIDAFLAAEQAATAAHEEPGSEPATSVAEAAPLDERPAAWAPAEEGDLAKSVHGDKLTPRDIPSVSPYSGRMTPANGSAAAAHWAPADDAEHDGDDLPVAATPSTSRYTPSSVPIIAPDEDPFGWDDAPAGPTAPAYRPTPIWGGDVVREEPRVQPDDEPLPAPGVDDATSDRSYEFASHDGASVPGDIVEPPEVAAETTSAEDTDFQPDAAIEVRSTTGAYPALSSAVYEPDDVGGWQASTGRDEERPHAPAASVGDSAHEIAGVLESLASELRSGALVAPSARGRSRASAVAAVLATLLEDRHDG